MNVQQEEGTLRAEPTRFVDILPNKHVIAESATSEREPIPPVAEGTEVGDTPESKEKAKAEPEVKADEPAPGEGVKKKDETPAWQKAFVTKEKKRREALEADNRALREQMAQMMALVQQIVPTPASTEPRKETFASEEEYIEAKAQWLADQKDAKRQHETKAEAEAREAKERLAAHSKRVAEAVDRIPDIEDLARDPTLPVSQGMGLAIMESDLGPDILKWLDDHREEAQKIAALSPAKGAAEIGRIEEKLAAKPPVTVSQVPKPITPVGGKGNVQRNKDDPELSDAEWAAQLDAERAAKVAALRR